MDFFNSKICTYEQISLDFTLISILKYYTYMLNASYIF